MGRGRAPSCSTDWLYQTDTSTLETLRKLAAPIITVIVLAALLVGGLKLKSLFDAKLSSAQEQVIRAEADAVKAELLAGNALTRADVANARADSAEATAIVLANQAQRLAAKLKAGRPGLDSLVATAPDTCSTYLEAVAGARDLAFETAEAWRMSHDSLATSLAVTRDALDSTTIALTALKGTSAILRGASTNLVEQSKRSFLEALIPTLGVGGAVGVDPFNGKFSKTVGLTLSWSF